MAVSLRIKDDFNTAGPFDPIWGYNSLKGSNPSYVSYIPPPGVSSLPDFNPDFTWESGSNTIGGGALPDPLARSFGVVFAHPETESWQDQYNVGYMNNLTPFGVISYPDEYIRWAVNNYGNPEPDPSALIGRKMRSAFDLKVTYDLIFNNSPSAMPTTFLTPFLNTRSVGQTNISGSSGGPSGGKNAFTYSSVNLRAMKFGLIGSDEILATIAHATWGGAMDEIDNQSQWVDQVNDWYSSVLGGKLAFPLNGENTQPGMDVSWDYPGKGYAVAGGMMYRIKNPTNRLEYRSVDGVIYIDSLFDGPGSSIVSATPLTMRDLFGPIGPENTNDFNNVRYHNFPDYKKFRVMPEEQVLSSRPGFLTMDIQAPMGSDYAGAPTMFGLANMAAKNTSPRAISVDNFEMDYKAGSINKNGWFVGSVR